MDNKETTHLLTSSNGQPVIIIKDMAMAREFYPMRFKYEMLSAGIIFSFLIITAGCVAVFIRWAFKEEE
jgi:hypothetical protein